MTIINDLLVTITTDNSGLTQGLDAAKGALKGFAIAAGATLGTATAAFAAVTAAAIRSADELERFATVSNTTSHEFQRWAAAAGTAGVETEKMAGILKDVNDRVGDFMATGGGPMADFFENVAPLVGVTAEQFRKLSGPQALQLYVDTLQRAGASQQDFTFYLEAMAGDATLLLPLLRNNGAELNRLADAAERAGAILSETTLAALVEANVSITQIQASFAGFTNELVAAVAPALSDAAAAFADMAGEGGPIADSIDRIAAAFGNVAAIMSSPEFIGAATTAMTLLIDLTSAAAEAVVWLTENVETATYAAAGMAVAAAALGGPLTLIAALTAAAVVGFNMMSAASETAEDAAYNVAAAEAALIGELNLFSQSASPSARNESRQRVISLKEQAVAALSAAQAELALASAMAENAAAKSDLNAADMLEASAGGGAGMGGLLDGVLPDEKAAAAANRVASITAQVRDLTAALKDMDASGGSDGGGVVVAPLPEVPGLGAPSNPNTGTGSGAAGGDLGARLEALQNELATERELLAAWYEDRQETLSEALAARQITEEEYRQSRERLEAEHAERMAAIDNASASARMEAMQTVFGGLSSLMSTESKKMFKIGQAAALAQATIDGLAAAQSAWAKGMATGGPALAAAYTAASLARTGANIAAIASQSVGGGGGGGGGSSAAAAVGTTTETRTANINFYGGFQPTQESIDMIASGLNDWLGDGGRLNVGGAS